MLFLTGTTLSVPRDDRRHHDHGRFANRQTAFSWFRFARQRMGEGLGPVKAALDAGATRIRPVLDDRAGDDHRHGSPWRWVLGEGAEQNAPLGRAVIGGLLFATVSTLFFVPVIFAGTHRRLEQRKRTPFVRGTFRTPKEK